MNWANMRKDVIQRATPRPMCPDSSNRCVLRSRAVAGYGLTGDRRHRYKRLDSALQFAKRRGTPTLALEKAMSEDVIATCDEIDAEIVRVLTEKFSWNQHRATSALQAILSCGIRVKIRGTVKECRDPGDDMFLECAALAKADLLVAGDKDLFDSRHVHRHVQRNAYCHVFGVPRSTISMRATKAKCIGGNVWAGC